MVNETSRIQIYSTIPFQICTFLCLKSLLIKNITTIIKQNKKSVLWKIIKHLLAMLKKFQIQSNNKKIEIFILEMRQFCRQIPTVLHNID